MRYAVVIEQAYGNFSAYVPDLPGCVATGASVADVERDIRDAIRFHIDGLREDGLPCACADEHCGVCGDLVFCGGVNASQFSRCLLYELGNPKSLLDRAPQVLALFQREDFSNQIPNEALKPL
jgi:predicted RNase H-like HicB family nuclease